MIQRRIESVLLEWGLWIYAIPLAISIVLLSILVLGPWGSVRLGTEDSQPEFSNLSYFSMLFAGGGFITATIVLFGPGQPAYALIVPDRMIGVTAETGARSVAVIGLVNSWFGWGFATWSIYVIFAVPIAYYSHRHGAPLRPSSTVHPYIEEHPRARNVIDILTIIAMSTAIGAPALSSSADFISGIEFQWGVDVARLGITLFVMAVATVYITSSVTGLHRGIRRLSLMTVGGFLLLGMLTIALGPSRQILLLTVNAVFLLPEQTVQIATNVTGTRALFFWSIGFGGGPIVGLFIARISYGRTIREVIVYAAFGSGLLSIIWISISSMGIMGLHLTGVTDIVEVINEMGTRAVSFPLWLSFPAGELVFMLFLGVLLLGLITTLDSAILSLAMTASATPHSPYSVVRICWGIVVFGSAVVISNLGHGALNTIGGALFATIGVVGIATVTVSLVSR